jgi:hypothetical protein
MSSPRRQTRVPSCHMQGSVLVSLVSLASLVSLVFLVELQTSSPRFLSVPRMGMPPFMHGHLYTAHAPRGAVLDSFARCAHVPRGRVAQHVLERRLASVPPLPDCALRRVRPRARGEDAIYEAHIRLEVPRPPTVQGAWLDLRRTAALDPFTLGASQRQGKPCRVQIPKSSPPASTSALRPIASRCWHRLAASLFQTPSATALSRHIASFKTANPRSTRLLCFWQDSQVCRRRCQPRRCCAA